MRSRILKVVGVFLVATTLLWSLVPFASAKTVVTMWTLLDVNKKDPREMALKQIIENFQKTNPDIEIKVEPQAFYTLATKFYMAHSTGNAPDISWIDTKNLGGLIKAEAAADLNELFIRNWPKEDEQDFYIRAGWDALAIEGKRYAAPVFHGTTTLFYRKDLFRSAQIDPSSLKTWDQFIAAAKKLTTEKGGRIDVWGLGIPLAADKTETNPVIISLLELQGKLFENCKPLYATEAGVKSLKLQADFITTYKISPPESIVYTNDDIMDQFAAGRYAIAVAPAARYPKTLAEAKWGKENLGLLPWPNWTAKQYGPLPVKGWWIAISKKSPRIKEAAKFVEFMLNRESAMLWGKIGGQVPLRKSVMRDPFYTEPKNEYMQELVKWWGNWSWLEPPECNTRGIESDLNLATHRVILDKISPMEALKEAERKLLGRQ